MSHKNTSGLRPLHLFAAFVSAAVLATIIGGLYLAGSPALERAKRFDTERVNSLDQIYYGVTAFYDSKGALPANLGELSKTQPYLRIGDPETNKHYTYLVTSATAFRLCATFSTNSDATDTPYGPRAIPIPPFQDNRPTWTHDAGETCFDIDILQNRTYPPCDASNLAACGPAAECVRINDSTQPTCVPKGKACAVAGCTENNCVTNKTYPPQVQCTTSTETTP